MAPSSISSTELPESDGLAALAADSRTVAIWTLVSRVSGVGRVIVVAAVLGPTYFGNLFQTLNTLPNIIHVMLIGQLITALLVPALVRHLDLRDTAGAARLAGGFLGAMFLVAAIVVGLCLLLDAAMIGLITAAVADPQIRAEQMRVGWPLLIMLLPQIFLYGIAASAAAVQQAHRKFALPAAAPALENLGTIAVIGATAWLYGMGLDVADVTAPQILFIGVGATMAVALHAAVQWWGAYRLGITLFPRAGWRNAEVQQLIRLAIPSSGYAALNTLTLFGFLIVAGALPGGAVAFQIGYNFFSLPGAVGAQPAAAAMLPRLSRAFSQGNEGAMQSIYRDSLAIAGFVAVPAGFFFLFLCTALAPVVSFGEMSTPVGLMLVAASIGSMGPAILGEAAFIVLTSAAYACRDAVSPFRATLLRTGISLIGMAVALLVLEGTAIIWALGLSFSAASFAATAYLYLRLARLRAHVPSGWWMSLLGNLAVAAIAVVPGWAVAYLFFQAGGNSSGDVVVGLAAIGVSGVTYLLVQWRRGSREFTALFSMAGPAPPQDRFVETPIGQSGK